jgi:pyruvate formate lyase activating enzyme
MTRRNFIRKAFLTGSAAVGVAQLGGLSTFADAEQEKELPLSLHEASYYEKLENLEIRCNLEPRQCVINEGERGYCGARENRGGIYYTLVYERPCAAYPEPIERHHFYHLLPGQKALAIGTAGCNLRCRFCESWPISQSRPEDTPFEKLSAEGVVERAIAENCHAIIFAYNEPTIYFEYMLDIAKVARKSGLITAAQTAGHIYSEPLKEVCEYLDAINVDLKGFTQEYYQKNCGGGKIELEYVLNSIKIINQTRSMLEITNLIVPELNDTPQLISDMSIWIRENVSSDVPLHFARFFPNYQLAKHYATPLETLEAAYDIARSAGLQYVYLDNVGSHKATSTYCPKCGEMLIRRSESKVDIVGIKNGQCMKCEHKIQGIW